MADGKPIISLEEYQRREDAMEGLCLACGATVSGVEGDAEEFPCPSCEENQVQGIQNAMIDGNVLIEGAEEGFI